LGNVYRLLKKAQMQGDRNFEDESYIEVRRNDEK
jgi:hypothetical protein